jgi:hypothetical protein
MLYVVTIHGKKKTLSIMEVSFWSSLWLLFIVFAVFPHFLLGIAGVLKFSRVFDLLIVIALMILSLVLFLSYFRQKETARQVEQLVREMALYEKREQCKLQSRKKK